jgi:hypothetical protein
MKLVLAELKKLAGQVKSEEEKGTRMRADITGIHNKSKEF